MSFYTTAAAENTTTTTTENKEKNKKKMITLKSCDGEKFEIDASLAMTSKTIKYKIEHGYADQEIPMYGSPGTILKKVIEYWEKHAVKADDDDLKDWDEAFLADVDVDDEMTLSDIITTAYYLCIHDLVDLAFAKLLRKELKIKSSE